MEETNGLSQIELEGNYYAQAYITLKSFKDGQDHYTRYSAANLESAIKSHEYNTRILFQLQSNVSALRDYLTENYERIDSEVVEELANLFDITLEKTITVTATVEFEMEITLPIHEVDDFAVSEYDFDFEVNSYKYMIDNSNTSVADWNIND